MCLRFQFCTHQRVCILYFLFKKSNSLYPNVHSHSYAYWATQLLDTVATYPLYLSNISLLSHKLSQLSQPSSDFPPIYPYSYYLSHLSLYIILLFTQNSRLSLSFSFLHLFQQSSSSFLSFPFLTFIAFLLYDPLVDMLNILYRQTATFPIIL